MNRSEANRPAGGAGLGYYITFCSIKKNNIISIVRYFIVRYPFLVAGHRPPKGCTIFPLNEACFQRNILLDRPC